MDWVNQLPVQAKNLLNAKFAKPQDPSSITTALFGRKGYRILLSMSMSMSMTQCHGL